MAEIDISKVEQNDEVFSTTPEAEAEFKRIALFKKLQLFPIFDSYASILKFFRIGVITLFFTVLLLFAGAVYFYSELYTVNRHLIAESRRVSQYLYEQEILNLQTFGARISADYFSLSYYNSEKVAETLLPFLHPLAVSDIRKQLADLSLLARNGELIQHPANIDYSKIVIRADREVDGKRVYFLRIPVQVAIRKASSSNSKTLTSTLGMYVLRGETSIRNPYGFWIMEMGPLKTN